LRLKRITYENFRNHRLLSFEPSEGVNLIYGPNGSGKTSILEGIHYCALTKGFVSAKDGECLLFGSDYFLLHGVFIDCSENQTTVKVTCQREKEKQIIVNNSEIKPFSSHIGNIPCITFSPSEIVIVNGAPAERRRFIDNAISQTDRRYLDDLLSYRRVLHQRNALLSQLYERKNVHGDMLAIWTENISKLAASIVHARIKFLAVFFQYFCEIYGKLSSKDQPSINYGCSLEKIREDTPVELLYSRFLSRYKETEKQEIQRAQTMTGPHRDDLFFLLDGKEIKKYASQGQLRTFLICLKLSQQRLFNAAFGENPVCLFDDIFSELDASRRADIFGILETCGQTIITSAERREQRNVHVFSMESLKKNREP